MIGIVGISNKILVWPNINIIEITASVPLILSILIFKNIVRIAISILIRIPVIHYHIYTASNFI